MEFHKIDYKYLNSRQKENYNYQKVSAVLADYGITTMRLTDDWQNADFIAQNINGEFLKVQLKTRFTLSHIYKNKDLYICFREDNDWYLFPHDEMVSKFILEKKYAETVSWKQNGAYSFPRLPKNIKRLLEEYKIN